MKNTKNGTINILFILILLSISHNVFAAEELERQMNWTSWVPLLVIIFGIGYGITAIAYMLGQFLKNSSLLAWSKNELAEVNMSAIIAGIIFLIIILIDTLYSSWAGRTPLDISTNFLSSTTSNLINAWIGGTQVELLLNILAGPPVNLGGQATAQGSGITGAIALGRTPPGSQSGSSERTGSPLPIPPIIMFTIGDISYFPFYGFSLYSALLSQLSSFILTAIVITLSYDVILTFIKLVALPVLIPLGIFLRIFSLTRKLGSTLIAIGISLYIFFPISILILKGIVNTEYYPVSLPQKPVFHSCGINYDPGSLIRPFLGPDFTCNEGHMKWCVNCNRLFGRLLRLFPFLKIVCYFLTILLWLIYLAIAIIKIIFWMAWVQVACIDPTGSIAGFFGIGGGGIMQLVTIKKTLSFTKSFGADLGDYVLDAIAYISSLVIPIVISPVITFIILITGIRSVSAAIGGEITILGISGLI